MNSLFQLDIPKRKGLCSYQGERLLPGMDIYSLLVEKKDTSQLERRDFCSDCWAQVRHLQCADRTAQGYWRSKIEKKKGAAGSTRVDLALILLIKLKEAQEVNEAELFVLCLFLSHARKIALRQEFQKDGVGYQLYEILSLEEFITVQVMNLSDLEITNLQHSLAKQLYHGK